MAGTTLAIAIAKECADTLTLLFAPIVTLLAWLSAVSDA